METITVITTLTALGQENRLAIFRLLVEQGPEGMSAGAIGEQLGLANATLSFHLKELSHAALILAKPQGRFIYYAANFEHMNDLMIYLTQNCCQGRSCVLPPLCKPHPQTHRKISK